jgi:hypothetical protein
MTVLQNKEKMLVLLLQMKKVNLVNEYISSGNAKDGYKNSSMEPKKLAWFHK